MLQSSPTIKPINTHSPSRLSFNFTCDWTRRMINFNDPASTLEWIFYLPAYASTPWQSTSLMSITMIDDRTRNKLCNTEPTRLVKSYSKGRIWWEYIPAEKTSKHHILPNPSVTTPVSDGLLWVRMFSLKPFINSTKLRHAICPSIRDLFQRGGGSFARNLCKRPEVS